MGRFFHEFKEFAVKGNVIDMAVGVVIGGAFGKIVTSLVSDIIMPAVGSLLGGTNSTEWKWIIKKAVMDGETILKPAVSINYGNFIQVIVDFIIIAFSIFLVIKGINALKNKVEKPKPEVKPAEPVVPEDVKLLREIRDLLKKD
jgi:large conductance mechanosensitive channel protein